MKNKIIRYTLASLPLLFLSLSVAADAVSDGGGAGGGNSNFYQNFLRNGMLILSGLAILGAVAALVQLLNMMIKVQQLRIYQETGFEGFKEAVKAPKESLWKRLYKRATRVAPIEKEKDIMFEHEYDGIRELDNSLPPWWVWMFYLSILFAGVYMTYYHFTGIGLSQEEQYEREMERAQEAIQAYKEQQANDIDEDNLPMIEAEDQIALGESLFDANCKTCHGQFGEGGIGPNLTDKYWLHGGSISDVFKTIKYGVPEKGMIAWKTQMRPVDMHRVASFIMTLRGTDPPNAKEPQGEIYRQVQNEDSEVDSTKTEVIGMRE